VGQNNGKISELWLADTEWCHLIASEVGKAAIFPSYGGVAQSDGVVELGYSPSL